MRSGIMTGTGKTQAIRELLLIFALLCGPFLLPMGRAQTADNYINRGYSRFEAGDLDGALTAFNLAIVLNSKSAEAYVGRSLIEARRGELDSAAADDTRAIELDPKHAMAYVYRGDIKQDKGDHEGALADMNRAVDVSPVSALVRLARCRIEVTTRDYLAAMADCDRAVQLTPTWPDAFNMRANIKRAKGDFAGAMSDCDEAVRLGPRRAIGYNSRGRLKNVEGDFTGAAADLSIAIRIEPKSPAPYKLRGIAYASQQRWADALADFRQCRDLTKGQDIYSSIYVWISSARLDIAADANQKLAADLAALPKTDANAWVCQVGGYLLGKVAAADLFAEATSPVPQTDAQHRCEAEYYVGIKKFLAGDKTGAAESFKRCMATDQTDYVEYMFAKTELRDL